MSFIILKNPLTVYVQFLIESIVNRLHFQRFRVGYMARVRNCKIEPNVSISEHCFISETKIGFCSFIALESRISLTSIGKFCSIGPGCRIGVGIHPTRDVVSTSPVFYSLTPPVATTFARRQSFEEKLPVNIGNDVWIGANAVILDGVSIGNGAIVGAGAVVTSDVPPYAIYGGVPAKLIRMRFSDEQIAQIERIAWWDRDESWLRSHADLFSNASRFIPAVDDPARADAENSAMSRDVKGRAVEHL